MRTYIVLRSTANGDMHPVELTEANGAYQAIKRAREARITDDAGAAEESWHAVPVRNWTTVAVVTEVPAPTTTYTDAELPELPLREAPHVEADAPDADPVDPEPAEEHKTLTGAAGAATGGNAA